jgi:CRISPR-associated protein Cst1
MEGIYFNQWRNWMFSILPNSAYTQPRLSEAKREAFRRTFIYGFRAPQPDVGVQCVFCGRNALERAFRHHVPLLTGEGMVNFFPQGDAGLPVCGICLLAVQAFLLGAVRCQGRALFVHADDEEMTLEFAKRFLQENRRSFTLEVKHPRTFFVARLCEVESERRERVELEEKPPCSVTVYHLTNYGTNADIALYHFPYQLVAFLRQAERAPHGQIWRQIVKRAWELSLGKRKGKGKASHSSMGLQPLEEPEAARNYLFEDLFDLPRNASSFVRTYFLRRAYRSHFIEDPRRVYNLQGELELVSWRLTEIFLKEVMNMESHRIETIKRVADRVAEEIDTTNDRQLFRRLWMSRTYAELRHALVVANTRCAQSGKEPLLTFDDFVTVFEFGEDSQRLDWNLARDLLLIRVIERLHQGGWFSKHADVIEQDEMPASVPIANE